MKTSEHSSGDKAQVISLLTLLGLVIPFGNLLGPYLLRLPVGSRESNFRKKLFKVELFITIICLSLSFVLAVKALSGINAGMPIDANLLSYSLAVIVLQGLAIIIVAFFAYFKARNNFTQSEALA